MQGSGFAFKYANSWLDRPTSFAVDPINLPLSDQQFSSPKLWGAFEDGTPDNWGRRVLLATRTQHPQNEIEWLLASRGAGVGCLLYSASRSRLPTLHQPPTFEDLLQLLLATDQIQQGEIKRPELAKLLEYGSSMGGARPKVTVSYKGAEWIAKLERSDDLFNQPRAEFASLQMSKDAGMPTADHELVDVAGRSVLLVKRFDRHDGMREHFLSAYSLIHPVKMRMGDTGGPMSYLRIADTIKKISDHAEADMHDLYRRMIFNVLIGNSDDHLKNHAVVLNSRTTYGLSPVYDVLPHPSDLGLQALIIGAAGRASTIENVLSSSERFGVHPELALKMLDEVHQVTRQSANYFMAAGMAPNEVSILANTCSRLDQSVVAALNRAESLQIPRGPRQ
jgi:serine/threonine-protein kinase HipA